FHLAFSEPVQKARSVSGSIVLYRASDADLDVQLDFLPDSNGVISIPTSLLKPGLYELKIDLMMDEVPCYLSRSLSF
ncbi:MAG: hypothetical protein KDC62_11950, partial [Aequorivita sp.]|nr:hypothetical protein [Aequorivita sp.]